MAGTATAVLVLVSEWEKKKHKHPTEAAEAVDLYQPLNTYL